MGHLQKNGLGGGGGAIQDIECRKHYSVYSIALQNSRFPNFSSVLALDFERVRSMARISIRQIFTLYLQCLHACSSDRANSTEGKDTQLICVQQDQNRTE